MMLVIHNRFAEPTTLKEWVIIAVLLIIAGMAKGIMDRLAHHPGTLPEWMQKSRFWGKESWRNKWKNGDISQGERFPLSSTLLVFLTDGWHLMQAVFLAAFAGAMVMLTKGLRWLKFIGIRMVLWIGFVIGYK